MTTPKYNCTQQELYTIAKVAWQSNLQHLVDFNDFKTKYDNAYATARLAEVNAAESIPDEQARNAASEINRIILEEAAVACLNAWQKLKRYTADAFPVAYQKVKLEESGSDYYLKASQSNWESVQGLMSSGENYLIKNQTALVANNNMPAAFSATFTALKTDFNTKLTTFLDSEEIAKQGTQAKVSANNNIYSFLIDMMLDGQEIFKTDEAIRSQFIFSDVLYLVSGAGSAGFKGIVTSTDGITPVKGAIISIIGKTNTATSDTDGKYNYSPIASGTYNLTITATGYADLLVTDHKVLVGTISTLNIKLTPSS